MLDREGILRRSLLKRSRKREAAFPVIFLAKSGWEKFRPDRVGPGKFCAATGTQPDYSGMPLFQPEKSGAIAYGDPGHYPAGGNLSAGRPGRVFAEVGAPAPCRPGVVERGPLVVGRTSGPAREGAVVNYRNQRHKDGQFGRSKKNRDGEFIFYQQIYFGLT